MSCGFMNEAPLAEMCDVLDAIKIDLKGFSEDFYHNVCQAELQPGPAQHQADRARAACISRSSTSSFRRSTTPRQMLTGLVDWIAGELGPDVPIHFTRFHPDYQLLNLPPTPVATLDKVRDLAMAGESIMPTSATCPGIRATIPTVQSAARS